MPQGRSSRRPDHVDILVNNAGAIPGGDLWQVDGEAWRKGWEVKVFGYIDLCRAIYPVMKQAGGGVILNNIGNGGENFDFRYIAGSTRKRGPDGVQPGAGRPQP